MNGPMHRIRRGVTFLAGFLLLAVCVHFLLSGRGTTLLDSIYWFFITVSGVGYGEKSSIAPRVQIWTIIVIVVGMSGVAYVLGAILQMITEGEINRALGTRRMSREIEKLEGHVVICGFGRMGRILAESLTSEQVPLVIVETNNDLVIEGQDAGYLVVPGDATNEDVLLAAGIEKAATLVSALAQDADNVFLTLTARNLNPNLEIIARGEQPRTRRKLIQAGANRVIMPAVIGAKRISHLVTRPYASELLETVLDETKLNVDLCEVPIRGSSSLINQSISEVTALREHGMLIIGIRHADAEITFNPPSTYRFHADDTLIALGEREAIERFRIAYG